MIQNKKRIISLILMLTLLVSALVVGAVTASAADEESITVTGASGKLSGTTSISWTSSNYQVVNYKNDSTTAIRTSDSDHFRLYVGNKFTVSGKNGEKISKVVITCTGSSYLTSATKNTVNDGWTVSASGTEVTYTATSGSSSELTITIGVQSRVKSVVITPATSSEPGVPEPEVPAPEIGNEATISFANTTHRVSQDTQSQVWTNSGLTLTNNKAESTNDIINSSNPVRLYKNSTITIEFSGMTKIEFACNTKDYATALANSIADDDEVKCVQDGTSVTLTFSKAMDEYTITLSGGQVRLNTITASAVEITCKHNNVTTTTVEATCTKDGSTTETCKDCGEIVSTKVIEKLGHSYNDGEITTEPTCTEQGEKTYTCSVCNNKKTEAVVSNGHKYADGVCSVCGEKEINYSGRYVIAVNRGANANYFYMTSDLGTASTKRYQAVDSSLTDLPTTVCLESEYIFVLVKNDEDGTYKIYAEGVEGDNYLGWSSGNSGILVAEADAISFTVDLIEGGLYNIHFAVNATEERYLSLNSASDSDYFAFYKGTQSQDLSLVPVSDGHIYVSGKCACGETATLTEAVAENNATIILGEGATLEDKLVITGSNVTIDLNGHTITASGLVTFGNGTKIIDSGTTKGLIKVAKRGNIVFAPEGSSAVNEGAITVWNGEGYVVADVTDRYVQPEVEGKADNSFIIDFKPKFDGVAHSQIAAGNNATGLIFKVKVTGTDGFDRTYTVSDSIIVQAYDGKSVRLNLTNAKEGVTYTVQLIIESECRLHYVGELGQYTYTVPTDAE